jgi:FtsP/CotA-like multicopper oxidase with cupredoxin domain
VSQGVTLNAALSQIDLGGRIVTAWVYGQQLPGPPIRAVAGERIRVTLTNDLPQDTSVHWHGLAVPNAMDGVPGVTTPAVQPGGHFVYDFVLPDAGTHWFHPHTGLQLDTGLYASFIVDDPAETGDYDQEWVLVLDDWTQGVGPDPEQIFEGLVAAGERDSGAMMGGMGHGHMGMGGGDVTYPMFLINGRPANDPDSLLVQPGDRVRLRIINAGADTIFTVALGGHRMKITHSDGFPVRPVVADAVQIGMGERYDVVVQVSEAGVFPVVAEPVGKVGEARALLRSVGGPVPPPQRPEGLDMYPVGAWMLQSATAVELPAATPEVVHDLVLSGSMAPYVWTFNGVTYDRSRPLTVESGQAVRLRLSNMSMMSHPVHLHGHTFQIGPAGAGGARKDTLLLAPMARAEVDLVADNPGAWMLHCHNAYHAEAGMMTRLDYTT